MKTGIVSMSWSRQTHVHMPCGTVACTQVVRPYCLCRDQRGFVEADSWKAVEENPVALSLSMVEMNQGLGNVESSSPFPPTKNKLPVDG